MTPPYNIFLKQESVCLKGWGGGEWQKLNEILKSYSLARVERLFCLAHIISKASQPIWPGLYGSDIKILHIGNKDYIGDFLSQPLFSFVLVQHVDLFQPFS